MDVISHDGIQYEISVLSLAHEDGVAVELVDISVDGGLIAEAKVTRERVTLVRQEPMPTQIYEWWAKRVVQAARRQPQIGELESGA